MINVIFKNSLENNLNLKLTELNVKIKWILNSTTMTIFTTIKALFLSTICNYMRKSLTKENSIFTDTVLYQKMGFHIHIPTSPNVMWDQLL
jgi:hypothetical protein